MGQLHLPRRRSVHHLLHRAASVLQFRVALLQGENFFLKKVIFSFKTVIANAELCIVIVVFTVP